MYWGGPLGVLPGCFWGSHGAAFLISNRVVGVQCLPGEGAEEAFGVVRRSSVLAEEELWLLATCTQVPAARPVRLCVYEWLGESWLAASTRQHRAMATEQCSNKRPEHVRTPKLQGKGEPLKPTSSEARANRSHERLHARRDMHPPRRRVAVRGPALL